MDRINTGKPILWCCLLTSDWERAYEALNKAVRLVPALAPKSLLNTDKQHMRRQVVGLASNAAAVALQAGKDPFVCLEILELGRGVLATSLDDMRIDVLDLKEKEPELAEQFVSLRDELDFPAWRARSGDEDRKRYIGRLRRIGGTMPTEILNNWLRKFETAQGSKTSSSHLLRRS